MYLEPIYDGRKSFYYKARYFIDGDKITLYSYGTPVVIIDEKQNTIHFDMRCTCSPTTLRHTKEFIKQFISKYLCIKKPTLDELCGKTIDIKDLTKMGESK